MSIHRLFVGRSTRCSSKAAGLFLYSPPRRYIFDKATSRSSSRRNRKSIDISSSPRKGGGPGPKPSQVGASTSKNASSWGSTIVDIGPIPSYFYLRHESTILKPVHSGRAAWGGLLSLTGVNFVILSLWNDQDTADEQVMMDNFTTNITNTMQRPWTLSTASISHQNLMHFAGNMFALWLFGFPTYRIIGTVEFFKLYVFGGIACSFTHVLHNAATGKTQPPITKEERNRVENMAKVYGIQNERELPLDIRERLAHADKASLGASGSCMAVSAVAAALFPLDRIRMHALYRFYIPLPLAVTLFVGSDLVGITQEGSPTDHAGHLGGLAFGAMYAYTSWYSGRWRTTGQLPIVYRWKEMMRRR